jgi:hypothetical protein
MSFGTNVTDMTPNKLTKSEQTLRKLKEVLKQQREQKEGGTRATDGQPKQGRAGS